MGGAGPIRRLAGQRGVTYLVVMAAIVLMGISSSMIGKVWSVEVQRDREVELLFRGNRIKEAIKAFAADFDVTKGTRTTRYPVNLLELTKGPKRYLPVLYKDPITGKDFDVIKNGAEIQGVRSTSKKRPLNQVWFKEAKTYSAIIFTALDEQGQGAAVPAVPPAPPSQSPPAGS